MQHMPSKAEIQSQQSWCSICEEQFGGKQFTDRLWLKTIGNRDYLVCKRHRGGRGYGRNKTDSRRADS